MRHTHQCSQNGIELCAFLRIEEQPTPDGRYITLVNAYA